MNLDGYTTNQRFTQETDEPACPNCDCTDASDVDCWCSCHFKREECE